jgi:signal transduction histidine kinase
LDAGRGMGMNVVKRRIVDDCEGEIAVHSEPGRFCEFTFELPALAVRNGARRFEDAADSPARLVQA